MGPQPRAAGSLGTAGQLNYSSSKAGADKVVADVTIRRDVLRNYANRVADLVVTVQDVLFRAIPERLARALLTLARDGVVDATHQAIAAELGSAREVVSRILQKFERDGVIAAERGRIVIRDGEALRRMAAPEP